MAAGLPVVATNVQGIPEVLEDTDAIMTQPDDPAAFRRAVEEVLGRPRSWSSAALRGAGCWASLYRMERRIDSMVKLFEDTIAETEA